MLLASAVAAFALDILQIDGSLRVDKAAVQAIPYCMTVQAFGIKLASFVNQRLERMGVSRRHRDAVGGLMAAGTDGISHELVGRALLTGDPIEALCRGQLIAAVPQSLLVARDQGKHGRI